MEIGSHGIVVVGWGDADYSKDQHSCEPHNAGLYPAKGKAVERKERTDKVIVDGIDAFDDEGGKPTERAGTPTERPLDIVEWNAAEEAGEDDEDKKGTVGDAHDVIVGVERLYDKYGSNDQTDKQTQDLTGDGTSPHVAKEFGGEADNVSIADNLVHTLAEIIPVVLQFFQYLHILVYIKVVVVEFVDIGEPVPLAE
jgi:hypothetical protein